MTGLRVVGKALFEGLQYAEENPAVRKAADKALDVTAEHVLHQLPAALDPVVAPLLRMLVAKVENRLAGSAPADEEGS